MVAQDYTGIERRNENLETRIQLLRSPMVPMEQWHLLGSTTEKELAQEGKLGKQPGRLSNVCLSWSSLLL